ncbi:MAG: UbiA prenyltransferase family protein [Endomicrobium sp.]|jgi:4-hydroxybenzoate polyprenyltransferase|nr:UbiA prenyltransferase family protein [Endomicrobium sp.]
MKYLTIFVRLLRVDQYVKNCFIFLPLFFGGELFNLGLLTDELLFFLIFCFLSSFVYIINDIVDINEDRNHPTKKFRPIANNDVSTRTALIVGFALLIIAALLTLQFSLSIYICTISYLLLNIFYSLFLKRLAIIDVICVALCYVLRVLGGGFVSDQAISQWLIIMVFILSLFLALGKRWHDLKLVESSDIDGQVRKSLNGYSTNFLISLLTFFSAMNTICYVIYSITARNSGLMFDRYFYTTALWVILGNMRYLQIIFVLNSSLSPTQALIRDPMIRWSIILWVLHVGLFIYL